MRRWPRSGENPPVLRSKSYNIPVLTPVPEYDPERRHSVCQMTSCAEEAESSPETIVDQTLESLDSDAEGIFIDFRRCDL